MPMILRVSAIASIIVCLVLAWLSAGLFAVVFLVAAIDIACTMRGRPLIKAGPLAKSMYPGMEHETRPEETVH